MSAMSQEKERGGICHNLKQSLPWERERRDGMVPCFAQERQAGGLPLLPAVGEVMWSSPLSCLHTRNLRHLPTLASGTGVGGVDLYPGGWAIPEGD